MPQVQSDAVPPVVQLPFVASNPSLYGNTEIGVLHCAFDFCGKQNVHTNEQIIPAVLYNNDRKFNN